MLLDEFFYQISNVNIAVAMKPKWRRWRQIWKREFSAEVTNQNAWDKVAVELFFHMSLLDLEWWNLARICVNFVIVGGGDL